MIDPAIIALRRAFCRPPYTTLADVGLDGEYVTPLQIRAHSPTGPVLLAYHFIDAITARQAAASLRERGYLPEITFNRVIDDALRICGLSRADVYMTQAFHLLPATRSAAVPARDVDASFAAVTRHELEGRQVIALGTAAAQACKRGGVTPARTVMHPSARGLSVHEKAARLARAILDVRAICDTEQG
jgi:uncharacterized membrane protein